jgi:hypothetical protein
MDSEKSLDSSKLTASKKSTNEITLPEEFLKDFDNFKLPEEKIRFCLDKMRFSISQERAPRFREFWDIRKFCLPLFKENILSYVRSSLWNEFIEITAEARRLKDILDEQSSFTIEQIDLAISGLEKTISNFDEAAANSYQVKFNKSISVNLENLEEVQSEINFISTFIQRINELRKELIATEMRVRFKNKFFKRLNFLGDFLYPKRKEQVQNLSNIFSGIVQAFYDKYFQEDVIKTPFYILKDEIKSIQSISKELTLNNKVFTETRDLLSSCWDKIKELENEKKQEYKEKKETFVENKVIVLEKIEETITKVENLTFEQAEHAISEILKFMRSVELGREEVNELKDKLKSIKDPYDEKNREALELRIKEEKEALDKKRAEIADLKVLISKSSEDLKDEEDVKKVIVGAEAKIDSLNLTKAERNMLEREIKPLKDYYADLKEKALLAALSDDELKSLEKLKAISDERKAQKKVIKTQLETYRKELGSSGFDFEKAMMVREIIDSEKLRLKKVDEKIAEIEDKIAEIEGR